MKPARMWNKLIRNMRRFVTNTPTCLQNLVNLFHDRLTMQLSWSMRQLRLPGNGNSG